MQRVQMGQCRPQTSGSHALHVLVLLDVPETSGVRNVDSHKRPGNLGYRPSSKPLSMAVERKEMKGTLHDIRPSQEGYKVESLKEASQRPLSSVQLQVWNVDHSVIIDTSKDV